MEAWNCVILVEVFDNGGPSLVDARIEYLFPNQFWHRKVWVENLWGGERKHYFGSAVGWGLVRLILHTSLHLEIPCTYSLLTLHIYSTSNCREIWNSVEHLHHELFCRNCQRVKAVGFFRRKAPSCIFGRMFDRILNGTLPNNILEVGEGLRRSFPPLELHKGLTLPPNSLDLHQ